MNILIHLDPLDNDINMIQNRLETYAQMINSLIEIGANPKLYLNSIHIQRALKNISENLLIHDQWPVYTHHEYKSLAYSNNLPKTLTEDAHNIYKNISFKPELIITNTPSSLIRKTWKEELIVHYELGYFNRPPFPKIFQFDPIGYYHSSLLAKYPLIGEDGTRKEIEKLESKKQFLLTEIGVKPSEIGSVDAVYIPIHADSWATKTEFNYSKKIDSLILYANKNKTKTIFTNEKPQAPLAPHERERLSQFKNIHLIENDDMYGIGSKLALICKETHTFSPSLGLQTLFWGNQLSSPVQSSMIAWASLKSPIHKLSSYLDRFHIDDMRYIPELIGTWEKYNPYSKKG